MIARIARARWVGLAIGLSIALLAAATTSAALERDPATRLPIAEGFETVRVQCTRCHSAKLVTQNRATREGWTEIIRWMQRTQKLGPLGDDEVVILDYLARFFSPGPGSRIRRRPLPPDLRPPDVRPVPPETSTATE
jgi:hypothetical protein